MKKMGTVALAILMALSLGSALAAQGTVTLRLMAPWADKELQGFQPAMDKFMKDNPGIKIEYRTGRLEDVSTILSTQFSVKQTPYDVIDISAPSYITGEAAKGNVLALDGTVKESDFLDGGFDFLKVGGKIYGVPSIGGYNIPEYNKKAWKDAGLKDPSAAKTWDELLGLLRAYAKVSGVKAAIGTGAGVGWMNTTVIEQWICAFGGKDLYLGLLNGTVAWDSPKVKDLLGKYLLPLLKEGLFGEPDETVRDNMWKGQYGMLFGGTTDAGRLMPSSDYGILMFPGQKVNVMWTDFWFVPAYTPHPKEAKKLLQFLATEGQAIQVSNGGRIATYKKVPVKSYPPAEQYILSVIKDIAIVPDMDDSIGGKFQPTEWDQSKLLWSDPSTETLESVLAAMEAAAVETRAGAKK